MKRIVVLGAAESGVGAAVLAKKEGFDVFVSDMSKIKDKYKQMLDERGISWEEGQHTEELILNASEIVKSPGIPETAPMVAKAIQAGIPIISEIEFAGRYTTSKMICITGSNGKTTTTSLIYHIFKAAGYHTGMFGKWAGGYEGSVSTPDKRGVDEFYGYICQFQAHLYFPNFLNRYSRALGDTGVVREVLEQNIQHAMYGDDYNNRRQYSADLIHQRALDWLRKQDKETPFFGIFTYTLPHAELRQPDDSLLQAFRGKLLPERSFKGDNPSRYNPTPEAHAQFAAMITRLDAQVGEIMALLEERGLAENTVLIFTSDNGPHEEGGADPDYFNHDGKFRGLKRSTHEGGIRIPFIVRWPGHVKAASVSDQPFAFYDLMPTFCEMADIHDWEQRPWDCDGISILPTLTGKGRQRQHDHLYWEFHETDMLGVRQGDWKLVVRHGRCALYNLARDPHEDHDEAVKHPGIVRRLIQ